MSWEERKESVVVEGVHLSLNFVMGLMKKHPSVLPFMIYIANEDKHLERFAVRAKYMMLDPARNRYVKYIQNIRTIQECLCKRADKHLVPMINNTNVDKTVAAIHATVFSCLRRREAGDHLYDQTTNTVSVVDEEYRNQCTANSLSSKGMFQFIQRQGSSRYWMALLNDDGSVAKACPVDILDDNGKPIADHPLGNGIGTPMYGPLRIGKAEPVNLQFGHFGLSAWPGDTGGTNHTGSVDESRGEMTDNGSRYISSTCSSPRISDGPAKDRKEEQSVHGSDEDADEPLDVDSDDVLSDGQKEIVQEEPEGSVDEEYDDLAMEDIPSSGYNTDNEEDQSNKTASADVPSVSRDDSNTNHDLQEKDQKNAALFQKTKSEPLSYSPVPAFAPPHMDKTKKRSPHLENHRTTVSKHAQNPGPSITSQRSSA